MLKKFINSIAIWASEIGYWRHHPAKAVLNLVKLISCLAATALLLVTAVFVVVEPSRAAELPMET